MLTVGSARSVMPSVPLRAGHGPFGVVLALAAVLRVVTMLGYRPAQLYWGDSFSYLHLAAHPEPSTGFRPPGYPLLLALLRPFHSIELVVAVQHAMGLAVGVLIYALLRRAALPAWAATLAAVPGLFDASFLRLEHAVLSDMLLIFLVVAALAVITWRPVVSPRAAVAAGLLLGWAGLTRTVAVPLLGLFVLYLVARRSGWRPVVALALAGVLPLAAYAAWYHAHHGRFALSGSDGVALWARTMTFADCAVIRPPAAEARLCPNGTVVDAASEYVWAPGSAINLLPGGREANNDLARSFALRAIAAQPLDYLADVARDTALTFAWTPVPHPARVTPAFGFARGAWGLPAYPLVEQVRRDYDPDLRGLRSVEPYASFLIAYQYPAYLRGPYIAAILLLGGAGALLGRRPAALPWLTAVALLVVPVAVLDFDHRYVLPVIPVACLAAGLGMRPNPGKRRWQVVRWPAGRSE
ncbi:hypothetical protein DP939_01230 [Spongiactinospora rosea]|uniref:Dolichyl-phosphate-mannose-protein mannosyltransferase n=1 Tax=Spongiactinospora rosea TaxID=2248750 RepID=A0A366M6L6_9ACTN|nr:hypothetical protein [Spongiactinospora rosea]RBQ21370.1 hypothetical protein DP939_01230 [Spongiactinospora rosea]